MSALPAQIWLSRTQHGDQSSVEASDLLRLLHFNGTPAWKASLALPYIWEFTSQEPYCISTEIWLESSWNLADQYMQVGMKHDLGEWLSHSATPGIWQLLPTGTMTEVYYSYVNIDGKEIKLSVAIPLPFQSQSNSDLTADIQACMLSYCFRVPSCDINFDNHFLCLPNLLTSQINLIKNPPARFLRNGKACC